jgi:hypothetical protein
MRRAGPDVRRVKKRSRGFAGPLLGFAVLVGRRLTATFLEIPLLAAF